MKSKRWIIWNMLLKNQCTIKNVLADVRRFSSHCDVNWSKHLHHLYQINSLHPSDIDNNEAVTSFASFYSMTKSNTSFSPYYHNKIVRSIVFILQKNYRKHGQCLYKLMFWINFSSILFFVYPRALGFSSMSGCHVLFDSSESECGLIL